MDRRAGEQRVTFGFRRRGGAVHVKLSELEAALLRNLAGQVAGVLDGDRSDPVVARLFPDAHRSDPELAAEFRALTEDDLREGKRAAARALADGVPSGGGSVRLTPDEAEQWLAAVNDIRLALGIRLDVTADLEQELDALDPDDPRYDGLRVYEWLGMLEETLVEALTPAG